MKALFIGGIKSGKSRLAEEYALANAKSKPFYLATTEFIDQEMQERIEHHKHQRQEKFITLEEPLYIDKIIQEHEGTILVECLSMWINNMLYHGFKFEAMQTQINAIMKEEKNVVFVLNDVGSGVISENKLAREFVDISGKLSQLIAKDTDAVFHVIAGIGTKIK